MRKSEVLCKKREEIASSIEQAERDALQAHTLKQTYEEQIETLEEQGREILKTAKLKEPNLQARRIVHDAEKQAEEILKHTENRAGITKTQNNRRGSKQIAEIAMMAAEKILEKTTSSPRASSAYQSCDR